MYADASAGRAKRHQPQARKTGGGKSGARQGPRRRAPTAKRSARTERADSLSEPPKPATVWNVLAPTRMSASPIPLGAPKLMGALMGVRVSRLARSHVVVHCAAGGESERWSAEGSRERATHAQCPRFAVRTRGARRGARGAGRRCAWWPSATEGSASWRNGRPAAAGAINMGQTARRGERRRAGSAPRHAEWHVVILDVIVPN